jgi:hypothetical protein
MRHASPSVSLPSDNDWQIPSLRSDVPARIELPLIPWGSIGRTVRINRGTACFYVDDYRFESVLSSPERLLETGCQLAVEPNVSLFPDTPLAYALWATYRKRYCSRLWQNAGIGVLVDLCVPEELEGINLLGVPQGYPYWATRGFAARPSDVQRECATAARFGGSEAMVVVYGGGKTIRDLCSSIMNAVWAAPFDIVNSSSQ